MNLVLCSTFSSFNEVIYQQTLARLWVLSIIADIVLQDLENEALMSLGFTLPFFYRYVDDIACAIPSNKAVHILNTFNSFHPRLQFT